MPRTKIKICGITNEKDALGLTKYDIFALGFIITKKKIPSRVDLNSAIRIIKKLPSDVLSVISTSFQYPEEVVNLCQETGANVFQLQIGGVISDILKIKRKMPKLKVWKVIFTDKEPNLEEIAAFEKVSDAILIHSKEEEWPRGLRIAKVLKKPFILAGGLNLSNARLAIEKFKPYVIDLIRGVETIPGKKDFDKVEKLIQIVRSSEI